jgi:ABC-type transporter Mla MlaB component
VLDTVGTAESPKYQSLTAGIHVAQLTQRGSHDGSMIRIETSVRGDVVTFAVIGRIQSEDLPELKRLLQNSGKKSVVLDLQQVKLVDREAITFLANFEGDNATITNCPPYIHEWILRERAQP